MKDHMSIPEFYQQFPTEESCRQFIIKQRWPNGVTCPHCGHDKVYDIKGGMGYKCANCKERFSVRTGMIMESSRLPLQTWLLAINLMTTARKGISSVQFAKHLGVTQKTGWYLSNRIRKACTDGINPLTGEIEVDETFIGGKRKNMSNAKRKELTGRGTVGKQPVMGMLERGGQIIAMPVKSTEKDVLQGHIRTTIKKGSTVYTDEYKSYTGLKGYTHKTVSHSAGEYVRGMAHTNGIESHWALMKRGYIGTHHWWSMKHLHRYVTEYVHRHNNKGLTCVEAIGKVIRSGIGKKLTYRQLIEGVA